MAGLLGCLSGPGGGYGRGVCRLPRGAWKLKHNFISDKSSLGGETHPAGLYVDNPLITSDIFIIQPCKTF